MVAASSVHPWHSTAWYGTAWHGTAWHGTAWYGTAPLIGQGAWGRVLSPVQQPGTLHHCQWDPDCASCCSSWGTWWGRGQAGG